MKKIIITLLTLLFVEILNAQTFSNVIMNDIHENTFEPLHDLLDEGHYLAFTFFSYT